MEFWLSIGEVGVGVGAAKGGGERRGEVVFELLGL